MDLSLRGERMTETFGGREWLWYLAALSETSLLWSAWLYIAARRRSSLSLLLGLLFVTVFALSLGEQRYFFGQYGTYIGLETSRFAAHFRESIVNQVSADLWNYLTSKTVPLGAALALWLGCRRWLAPAPRHARGALCVVPVALVLALFAPFHQQSAQASTPDVLFLGAGGELLLLASGVRPPSQAGQQGARRSLPVPSLQSKVATPRNVVFFLMEGVRADATCRDPSAPCEITPYSHQLTPNRVSLLQMRSLSTATLISLAVLWTGLGPHEPEGPLSTQPLLFDYAHAAGWDTAYLTSQNARFGTLGNWLEGLQSQHIVTATDIEPSADIDLGAREDLLADRVCQQVPSLKEPYLAVIQLSGTHFPYRVEDNLPQPFQPATRSKAPEQTPAFFNLYRNSVHQQDRHLAQMIRCLRGAPSGPRTAMLLTSDHGEAFREHFQLGHSLSVLDEELHVPAWLDAPAGILSAEEAGNLKRKTAVPTFHVDITATVLDLMGIWNVPGVAQFRKKMLGHSLLEPEPNPRAIPLTNCAAVWGCAFESWGYMRGFHKLEARAWDPDWHCFDLSQDPEERHDLGRKGCGNLPDLAMTTFGRRPGAAPAKPTGRNR